jgi:carboxyl-terminal processing protease
MSSFEKFQRLLITLLISIGFFYGGYYFGKKGYLVEIRKNPPEVKIIDQYPNEAELDFGLFWDVWKMVSDDYLLRPVDNKKMMYGAIEGMVKSLGDPYTSFLPPKENETVNNSLAGKYEGIGAELGLRDNILIIVAPLDGSPAKAAGLRSGDKIVGIEGETTFGISIQEAVSRIRGEKGTTINLTIKTGDQEPREVPIKRDVITISSIRWEDKGDGIAYIRISRFGTETNEEWKRVVSEINAQMTELDSLVIDVRGNPGGYLRSAIFISEEFYDKKPIVWQEDSVGNQTKFEAERLGSFTTIPQVYVLIDGGSASASEILAASLKDNIGAVLAGVKTFGKGTIQDAKNFEDGSGVHITIAKWLTPNKEWVHDKGIEPDILIEITDEDIENSYDRQLEEVLELAKEI